ncbi:niacin transporter [Pilibacter termitis]|uniref:Niacin transporter n=1 Tax=Pilibacter termitis TaxID=263852 RepID=A0A1T4PLN8_9ENTE|nr:hypothetical protein [Pilibacter termitis]SJZ92483.1 niacin transporter [Pilibacter termitis]
MNTTAKNNVRILTISALLTALGILIPFVMPVKLVIGPASFTLASHVPVMIAMFFSPIMAMFVSLGTTVGFMLALPVPTIWLRALTHLIFAVGGAYVLQKRPDILTNKGKLQVFNFIIALIHALAEVLIVFGFYALGFGNLDTQALFNFLLLIGFGTIAHSMIDFQIAYVLANGLSRIYPIQAFEKASTHFKKSKLA